MTGQLPLDLRWPAHQRFDSFDGDENGVALDLLGAAAADATAAWVYLAGPVGSGRTHLLIAACAQANGSGRSAQYLSLDGLRAPRAEAIRGFGGSDLLAIDDLDAIVRDDAAEHAMFDLHNRCRAEGATLVFAASAAPSQLGLGLPDLVSRLAACTQATLKPLDEGARRVLLRSRARARGIELEEPVLDWLFARGRRDLASLLAVLERIDRASLAAQRRVTIPFLRDLLRDAA